MATKKLSTEDVVTQVRLAEVKRHDGEGILFPEGWPIRDVITNLERAERLEEEVYTFTHTLSAFVWDGAVAVDKAIKKLFGFGFGKETWSWGVKPPQLVSVATGPNRTDRLMTPIGAMTLPNIEGDVYVSGGVEQGKFVVKIIANVKRKHEKQIAALADEAQKFLDAESIYRGKAIKVSFSGEVTDPWTGQTIPNTPEFLQLNTALTQNDLILNKEIEDQLAISLFNPLDYMVSLRRLGKSAKRGVVLAGSYGMGKTLATSIVANKAVAGGVTFVLCDRADELADAIQFAKMYSPAIVSCEDIDRSLQGGRTVEMDHILNTVDGVESKAHEIFVVVTTNDVVSINQAAIRPGRLDDVIKFEAPDAHTTERLIRFYAQNSLGAEVDITAVAQKLAGNNPAIIAESVKRAELARVPHATEAELERGWLTLDAESLMMAANSMRYQIELLNRQPETNLTDLEKAATVIGVYLRNAIGTSARHSTVKQLQIAEAVETNHRS